MGISEACIRRPVMTTLITASLDRVRHLRLSPAGGGGAAARRFPDHPDHRDAARREPGDHGGLGRGADRAAVLDHLRHHVDDLDVGARPTTITIQFDLDRDIDGAALDVQTALSVAQRRLPVEMTTPPFFRKVNPGDFPVLFISLNSPTLPLSTVDEYAETMLAQQISQLPGVAQVLVYGSQKFAVRVQVDPVAAAARNISLDDIRTALAQGQFQHAGRHAHRRAAERHAVGVRARSARPPTTSKVVVAWRNGAPVKLDEIANVIDGVENDQVASWFNGDRAIVLAIQRQPDANTVEVVDAVKDACRASARRFRPRSTWRCCSTARSRSASRCTTCRRRC